MKRILLICLFALIACEEEEPQGDFFDPQALDENTVVVGDDFESAVECEGAGMIELKGQVLAPAGRLALFPDWLVPSAHAAPLEGELVVTGATVELYQRSKPDEILVTTTTDPVGRYCLNLPDSLEPSTAVILRATSGGTSLRRVVVHRQATTISVSSEAIARIIERNPEMSAAEAINLETVSDTAVDLLAGSTLDGMGVEAAVETVEKLMLADERVVAEMQD